MFEHDQPLGTAVTLTQILGDLADLSAFVFLRLNEFSHK